MKPNPKKRKAFAVVEEKTGLITEWHQDTLGKKELQMDVFYSKKTAEKAKYEWCGHTKLYKVVEIEISFSKPNKKIK